MPKALQASFGAAFLAGWTAVCPMSAESATLVELGNLKAIAVGTSHVCALTSAGGVKCWGSNRYAQLGDGTTTDRFHPVDVAGLAGVVSLSVGNNASCALTTGGIVKCWGENTGGLLGVGSGESVVKTPSDVVGLGTGVSAISVGHQFACALTTAGGVKCWGNNRSGQLGANLTDWYVVTPVDVVGLTSGATAVAAGWIHTCALTASGGAKCWGHNSGRVGDGTWIDRPTPVDVVGLASGVSAISAGNHHTCALTAAGGAKCWGSYGPALGNGSTQTSLTPVDVAGLGAGVKAISAGDDLTCAITTSGGAKCWGQNAPEELGGTFLAGGGGVGDGTNVDRTTPVDVQGLSSGVVSIFAATELGCAVLSSGVARCWGTNLMGQFGDGTTSSYRPYPLDVVGLSSGVTGISASEDNTCAVTQTGVQCWGTDAFGRMGTGPTYSNMHQVPTDMLGLANGAVLVSAGTNHSCVVTKTGAAMCTGINRRGELGDGTTLDRDVPVVVSGLGAGVTGVGAGEYGSCALTSAGGVKCWGDGIEGVNGDGTRTERLTPVDVSGLASGAIAVTRGRLHACALTAAGGVKCWGHNSDGQLGDGSKTSHWTPVDVVGLTSGVSAISAGNARTCALTTAGGVKCWGHPYDEVLDSAVVNVRPADMQGLATGVKAISSGDGHSCAVTAQGGVKCWGNNDYGELGDETTTKTFVPVDVVGLPSGVMAVAAGRNHTCALTEAGGVKCWGYDHECQLGAGNCRNRPYPGPVLVPAVTYALTIAKAGAGAGTVKSAPSGIDCAAACSASFASGTAVELTAVASSGSAFTGWGSPCSGTGICTVTMDAAKTLTATFGAAASGSLAASPATVDFGGQSMQTTSPAQNVVIANTGSSAVTVSSFSASTHFAVTHGCGTLPASLTAGASCTATVTFKPMSSGTLNGTLLVQSAVGTASAALVGIGERSLVTHYYRSILRRAADAGGKTFWDGEATRVRGLGVNVNEVWFALAGSFYGSAEYAAQGRDNAGFVTDMYNTFFNRAPDEAGLSYWAGLLTSGMPREVVLASFMFSSEFATFTQGIFGAASTRKEVDTVVDFYRGILGRLPDDGGFGYWLQLFRTAQCQGAGAVSAQAESISSQYANSPEYGARNRSNAQFVGDMYNAFLRRGGDLAGVQYWIGQLDSGARSRENVRQNFVASAEFSARVTAVIAQGCLQ